MILYMPYMNITAHKKEPNVHDGAFTSKLFNEIYI
jgi:hypothetical protein